MSKDLQSIIAQFKKETDYTLKVKGESLYYSGYLDLQGTAVTSLPDNLTVGGTLDLRGTAVTSLPDNLTVGGSLDLEGCTSITSLPDNLTVGGYLDLRGTAGTDTRHIRRTLTPEQRKRINDAKCRPIIWERRGRKYIKADGEFTVIDNHHGNVYRVHYPGSHKQLYLVTDGENHWAHGKTLAEARADLIYKISDRGTSAYKNMRLDDTLTFEEAIAAYRTITGACAAGTRNFIENRLPQPRKEQYTIREMLQLTKGEYGSGTFARFFNAKADSHE